MQARRVLSHLRMGQPLTSDDARWMVEALSAGDLSDAQAGAFAMGICHTPLSMEARTALTRAMRDSGDVLTWDLPGPVLDKHSTGGVGDCISLILAPALAACGAYVPMISGRGLGHTGGTLDKLEAIPGYRVEVSADRLRQVTQDVGCAIVGPNADIAPADKRLYAVRDVTGTVESVDLITASILSKKLAAGLEALVLDVKLGNGAFMTTREEAQMLARSLVETANAAGCRATALITDMSQPLATAAGNALEVIEVMETLTRSGVTHALWELTCALGGQVLHAADLVLTPEQGADEVSTALSSGAAAETFGRMVSALGGPADFVDRWRDRLPAAPVIRQIRPPRAGFVAGLDTRAIGEVVVGLGGGRLREGDRINPAVGLSQIAGLGEEVSQDRPLAQLHAASEAEADRAENAVLRAYRIGDVPLDPPTLILGSVYP
ncbi:thymidine phosphorylase [Actibacterium sp. 188UL27-1]|uniref:thymidine phosphorylase n=1 Tax=Actibacterium sp. 188UL27-1 TaxID=2786961 RepID=UPI00195BB782|nr:thymidine phosphorylase [Actibacterium sp. 188UL27-1]MBM7067369.1 thymidine phosphorylase [Actibacterium sp. 188UL27-1]